MAAVTPEELQRLAEAVGQIHGWDTRGVGMVVDPTPWEFSQVAREYLGPGSRVLDIGTGGGERFLALADAFGRGWALTGIPR